MIRASIDLGTNTCLLLIAGVEKAGKPVVKVLGDYATVVRLGEGLDQDKQFKFAAMERTLECLKGYADKVRAHAVDPAQVTCIATSQARDSGNWEEFRKRVQRETGFLFRLVSGEEEASLSFRGAILPGMNPGQSAVIDIGGGSTEFISLTGERVLGHSLDVGAVRFTERYLKSDPVIDAEFWKCQDEIDRLLQTLLPWRKSVGSTVQLVGVAGTVTTLAAYQLELEVFDAQKIDGAVLTRGDVHRLVEELKWRTVAERLALPGVEAGRADVLLAGALILWRAMEVLEFQSCVVSTRGLRYGAIGL
ncbi:Ppx/GppA phosphatase family protein [Bdellovibrionota bacterium FG-2]